MKTVHMIGHAHLDPVWLWRRRDGIDAALATVRSACDRLDEYPEFFFTCSSSWIHAQVEAIDPDLFERVRQHVVAGRWQPVGGMLIEPDCNLPSAASFRRLLAHGQAYFEQRFGVRTSVGYNIDSFGHDAYLPRYLREAGIDTYTFMRPGLHEKELPSELFRWRSPDDHEVVTFRLPQPYATRATDLKDHVAKALAAVPESIGHTMCFFGVGDHGGGPTREQIEWIRENAESIPGARLVFSHPRAFFDAVADDAATLPVVQDELQHHAIGCYSVERRIKTALRHAESSLEQAELALDRLAPDDGNARNTLVSAWDTVLFNEFHDILGGTSLDEESRRAAAELEAAAGVSDGVTTRISRRFFRDRAEPGVHKIVVFNSCDDAFAGLCSHEPWLDFDINRQPYQLLDEQGAAVPCQRIPGSSMTNGASGVLMRLRLPAGATRILTLVPDEVAPVAPPDAAASLAVNEEGLSNKEIAATIRNGVLTAEGWRIRMSVLGDRTDTWAHSAGNRFDTDDVQDVDFLREPRAVESGPLRAALRTHGAFLDSRVWCRIMVEESGAAVRLRFALTWIEAQHMLRLSMDAPQPIASRTDLVSGGPLIRKTDGLEYPLQGGLLVEAGERRLGVASPDVFSVSVNEQSVNLTMIRSPFTAHHDPSPGDAMPDQPLSDQGVHTFDITLLFDSGSTPSDVARAARVFALPPLVWDLTG